MNALYSRFASNALILLTITGCGLSEETSDSDVSAIEWATAQQGLQDAWVRTAEDNEAILNVVNIASVSVLDIDVGLNALAARNIVKYRQGSDQIDGTEDDNLFDSVEELEDVHYVGPSALQDLLMYLGRARSVHPSVNPYARAILHVVNNSSFEVLDIDIGLDIRAARNIVAHRRGPDGSECTDDDKPFRSIYVLDDIPWIGPSAQMKLREYIDALNITNDTALLAVSACDAPPKQPCFVDSTLSGAPYTPRFVEGWRVCLATGVTDPDAVLSALQEDLNYVKNALPPKTVEFLQAVNIWVEQDYSLGRYAGLYYPSKGWLSKRGYPTQWARGIMLPNAEKYVSKRSWPIVPNTATILHELAHAWHHQYLGYGYQPIKEAYYAAMRENLYGQVRYILGYISKAYASTNYIEYFAELSEAWFWRGDYYPFNHDDVLEHDPAAVRMLTEAWNPTGNGTKDQ